MTSPGRESREPQSREPRDQSSDGTPVLPDVVRVAGRGRGPLLEVAMVTAALVMGLVRPWDWLGQPVADDAGRDPGGAVREPVSAGGGPASAGADTATAPLPSPTCASPSSWRAATIESWTGRQARVWTAVEVVSATGPEDAAIQFRPIVSETVTAIGWCAPAVGTGRPPLAAAATLFRLGSNGPADEIPFDRLEPGAPDAMGELLVPAARVAGRRPAWEPGRYVIRLATPSGSYVRYLGLEVTAVFLPASPTPRPAVSGGAAPG